MKNFIFLLGLILLTANFQLTAQVTQQWVARYTGLGGLNGDQANAITVDLIGNIYVTGVSAGTSHWGDYATVKYNSSGVQQWTARYNGTADSDDTPVAIAVDPSGNVYVTGKSMQAGTGYDYVTIKYNTSGVQQWLARYNDSNNAYDEAVALGIDSYGNVYVTGSSYLSITTVKYNSAGVQQWVAHYSGPPNFPVAVAMAVDASGNVYIVGGGGIYTLKYNSSGVQQWVTHYPGPAIHPTNMAIDNAGNTYVCAFEWNYAAIKYNASGVQVWSYDGTNTPAGVPTSIAVDGSYNVYVTGVAWINGSNDYVTVKLNSSGVQQWLSNYNGPADSDDVPHSMALDASGNIYITGISKSNQTGYDYATVKYNSSGVQQWVQRYNGPANGWDEAKAIVVDPSGNVYVTGYSLGIGTDWDYSTIKYSQGPNGIQPNSNNIPGQFSLSQNYPNPFNPTTKIRFQVPPVGAYRDTPLRLVVYDILGKEIATLVNEPLAPGSYEISFDGSSLTSGLYFYKLQTGSFTQTKKMVLIK